IGDILAIVEFLNNKKIKQYVRLDLVISLIDCSTFNMFFKNISSIMLPYIKLSNLIILNKCNLVSKEIVEKNKETLENLNLNAHINICNTENDLSKIFKRNAILRLGKVLM
ncbi:MAG: GTP-binding protein, partial [Sarcina sp.]